MFYLQKLWQPLSGDRVYFDMEIQVKLYRRAVYTVKQVVSRTCGEEMFHVSTLLFQRI